MKKLILFTAVLFFSCFSPASAAPIVTITSPVDQSTFPAGSSITITATASKVAGVASSVYFYRGSTLLGEKIKPPYNFTWDEVPVGTYVLTAVASDANNTSTTSFPVTITVTPAPPVVDIISPANDSTFTAGTTINLTAAASEFKGTVANVAFYNGSTLLGQRRKTPYSYTWANVPAGSYTLTAVATDVNKVSTTSSPFTITVTPFSDSVIAITSPIQNSVFTAGTDITIAASAAESDGTVREIYFYDGTYFLGSTTQSPFIFTWTHVLAGNHSLTVEATDSNGGTLVSAPVNIIVNPSAILPQSPFPAKHKK